MDLINKTNKQTNKQEGNNNIVSHSLIFTLCFIVFNATFNNISVISWWSVLLVEETGIPRKN